MAKMLWLRSILYKGALWIVRKEEKRDLSCEGYFNPVNTLLCECRITVTYGDILQKIADNADRAMSQRRLFLDSALTLDKLAREIGCNRTYLSRALAQKKKMNYRNYLNDYRIKYAKELLSHKDYTLLDVAIISGFRNEKTFYNAVVQSGDKSWKSVKKRYLYRKNSDMADEKIIFSMNGVKKILPQSNRVILKDIYLSFFYGAKIGIIGLNGSGKSTLMKIIAGIDTAYDGEVVFSPGYSVGYLEQEPQLDDNKTVKEVVEEGVQQIVDLMKEYEQVNARFMEPMSDEQMSKLIEYQGELTDKIEHVNGWDLDSRLERAMDALMCPEPDALVKNLSGGERRRVALCRLLLQEPDVLLLDEPTNHLDTESIQWLEAHLKQYKGTVIAVTHDRYFLDNVAGWILELDRGEGIPWKGNYSSWLEQKARRLESEEKQESKRRKTLERELEWVRMAPKARHAKSKARLSAYEKMMNEDGRQKEERLEIFIPNGPRLGDKVIEAVGVAKSYGERLLFENLDFKLPPAGIVGVIGPNGAGKTTLFRLIMGYEKPDKGEFSIGPTVKIAYIDQQHKQIDPDKTVYQTIAENSEFIKLGNREVNARAYVSRFNFSGADQEKKCGVLSGGERNRLHLALTLKEEANVLLLDEPTNDVDVNTIRALEEGLENFAGCAVVISHDRWFLDRICTHILAFEGDSKVYFYEGTYSEYEENKKMRLGDVEPKRFKYKKLK
ncbi:MAG: energy-dependent translational throttle protein EttA [Bacteroidetes bacterium]|uniref:Energy-dependent translational throttle protein EttA n=1 Tax=Candidatus Egerieousia excrementavium TaxID=2840778 RepID=A0A9D9DQ31_9BACT|nr:energy-dependent translational throttle protein EttA [Candidatus Egerieousia excrementavium]